MRYARIKYFPIKYFQDADGFCVRSNGERRGPRGEMLGPNGELLGKDGKEMQH